MKKNSSLIGRHLICLGLLVSLSVPSFALTPMQLTNYSWYAQRAYNAYARALRILPTSWSCSTQRKLALYVYDTEGHSAYAVSSADTCQIPSSVGATDFYHAEYQNSAVQNPSCGALGYCDRVDWVKGTNPTATQYSSCYAGVQYPDSPPVVSNCNFPTFRPSCIQIASGFTANAYRISDYTFTEQYYFITFWYAPGCNVRAYSLEGTFFPAPTFSNLEDTALVRSAIQAAKNDCQDMKGLPCQLMKGDEALFDEALNTIDNGISVSTGVPDYHAIPPSDPAPYVPPDVVVNVPTATVNVNIVFSTSEIVNQLIGISSGVNGIYNFFTSTLTAGPEVSTIPITTAFDDFQNRISSLPIVSLMYNILPTSTETWRPCFDVTGFWAGYFEGSRPASSMIEENGEFCFTAFPWWDNMILLVRFLLQLGVFIWGVRYIWGSF